MMMVVRPLRSRRRACWTRASVLPPGRTVGGQVALALMWAAAITAVFAPLAVRAYRRTVS